MATREAKKVKKFEGEVVAGSEAAIEPEWMTGRGGASRKLLSGLPMGKEPRRRHRALCTEKRQPWFSSMVGLGGCRRLKSALGTRMPEVHVDLVSGLHVSVELSVFGSRKSE